MGPKRYLHNLATCKRLRVFSGGLPESASGSASSWPCPTAAECLRARSSSFDTWLCLLSSWNRGREGCWSRKRWKRSWPYCRDGKAATVSTQYRYNSLCYIQYTVQGGPEWRTHCQTALFLTTTPPIPTIPGKSHLFGWKSIPHRWSCPHKPFWQVLLC